MIRAVAYTRVSTDKEEQKTSIKNQEASYQDFCKQQGYELLKMYYDEGLSATSPNRKDFLNLLHDAGLDIIEGSEGKNIYFKTSSREPKFDCIVTKDVTRFARNQNSIDIAKKLVEKGVHIVFSNLSLSTLKENWQFEFGLYLNFAEMESRDKSNKVKAAHRQRAKQGKFHMPVPLYGYEYDADKEEYVINEAQAEIVREIFDLYVNKDMGLNLIANHLNKRGIKTHKGYLWRSSSLKRTIKNEKYKGLVILQRKTKTDITSSAKVITRDPNEWIPLEEGAIPPIVDKATWEKAQEILKSRIAVLKDGSLKGERKSKDIFYKKIKCSKCLSDYVRVSGTKIRKGERVTEQNYYCRNRRMFGSCDMRGVSYNVLEREISRLAKSGLHEYLSRNITDERKAANVLIDKLEVDIRNSEEKKTEIKKEIEHFSNQINKLYDAFLGEESSKAVVEITKSKIDEIQIKINKLESDLLEFDLIELENKIENISNRLRRIEEISKRKSFTFEELLDMVEMIAVYPNKKLHISISIPTLIGNVVFPEKFGYSEQTVRKGFDIYY